MERRYWLSLVIGVVSVLLIKRQSRVVGRKCDDVFDQYCKTGPFRAPLWQTLITLISQLGCLSWWATERIISGGSGTTKIDGVTDAFSDLLTEGPPPPIWAHGLMIVPALLSTAYLLLFYIALQTLQASTALILLTPGYLAELLFECCMNRRRIWPIRLSHVLFTACLLASLVCAGWDEVSEGLRWSHSLAGGIAFTNTGPTAPTASPEVVILAVFVGVAAGALLALRNVIFAGLLRRFEFDATQSLGMEGAIGAVAATVLLVFADAWRLEDTGITMFQLFTSTFLTYSTVAFIGIHLAACLCPHTAASDYLYKTAAVIFCETVSGSGLTSSPVALAGRALLLIAAALSWTQASESLAPRRTLDDQPYFSPPGPPPPSPDRCEHFMDLIVSEKRRGCPLCAAG